MAKKLTLNFEAQLLIQTLEFFKFFFFNANSKSEKILPFYTMCLSSLFKELWPFENCKMYRNVLKQGSHISGLTKFHDISRFFKKIPGIFSEYFNVASNYFWINGYIKVSPEQNISFPQYPIVTPAFTSTPQAKHTSG